MGQSKQLNPKKQAEYKREKISCTSKHHSRSKGIRNVNRPERNYIKAIIHLALICGELEELSIPLLKTSRIFFKMGYKPFVEPLKDIVDRKLQKRAETHGARKRRHGKPFTPRSLPKTFL
jgi:hypothetical protein